jgi:DNA-binding NtrC family response regulator
MLPYGLLIAEDDPSMVRLYKAFLQGVEGVSLLGVTPSGEELLRYFRRGGRAELLLLDIYLEGSNGVDILRELRGMGVDLDVIVVTSESSPRTVGEAMRLGVFDYLVKPFGGSRFRRALDDLVAFRRRIDRVNSRMSQDELDKLLGGARRSCPRDFIDLHLRVYYLSCRVLGRARWTGYPRRWGCPSPASGATWTTWSGRERWSSGSNTWGGAVRLTCTGSRRTFRLLTLEGVV